MLFFLRGGSLGGESEALNGWSLYHAGSWILRLISAMTGRQRGAERQSYGSLELPCQGLRGLKRAWKWGEEVIVQWGSRSVGGFRQHTKRRNAELFFYRATGDIVSEHGELGR